MLTEKQAQAGTKALRTAIRAWLIDIGYSNYVSDEQLSDEKVRTCALAVLDAAEAVKPKAK